MKYQLVFCVAAAALVCLHAAPLSLSEASVQPQHLKAKKPLDIWSDCTKPNAMGKIGHVSIIPDPPQKGHTLNVTVQIILLEDVSKGQVKVSLVLDHFVPVVNQVYQLCDLVQDIGKKCPLKKGPIDIGINTDIPSSAPRGSYSGSIEVLDQNQKQLICIKTDFKM